MKIGVIIPSAPGNCSRRRYCNFIQFNWSQVWSGDSDISPSVTSAGDTDAEQDMVARLALATVVPDV
jgi:hypothetical protein